MSGRAKARAWRRLEQETPTTAEPWEELGGSRKGAGADYSGLPVDCSSCGRKLVVHGVQDGFGRKKLLASCAVHGPVGSKTW
jgi:hypothetical protein